MENFHVDENCGIDMKNKTVDVGSDETNCTWVEEQNRLQENSTNNSLEAELDEETQQKLRGDAIGDTLYSEKFVLTTLMQLIKKEWNTKFEEDLCALWDMTLEPSIRDYLFGKDFPKIAITAINATEQPRLAEILVGILGNICSAPKNDLANNLEQINEIVNLIHCQDKETLVQVVRFMKAIAFQRNKIDFINSNILERLFTFNEFDLNICTCQLLNEITTDQKLPENLMSSSMLKFVLNSLQTYYEVDEFERLHFIEWNANKKARLINCLNIFCNYCSYINTSVDNRLYEESLSYCTHLFNYVYDNLLRDMSDNQNCLIPITSEVEFIIESLTFICRIINVTNFVSNYFLCFSKMFKTALECDTENANIFVEFLCWYMSSYVESVDNIKAIILTEYSKEDALLLIKEIIKRIANFPDIDCLSKFDQLTHRINYCAVDSVHSRG